MKHTIFILIAVIALISFGCEETEFNIDSLNGSWIESSSRADTLVFDSNEFEGWLYLNRVKELRNGYMLPKIGSGSYDYEISNDSIVLQYHLSSCMCPKSYTFEILSGEDKLKIGNFYDDDIPLGEMLTFEKL